MIINQLGRYWYGMGKQIMNEKHNMLVSTYVCICGWLFWHTLLMIYKSQSQKMTLQSLKGSSPVGKHK